MAPGGATLQSSTLGGSASRFNLSPIFTEGVPFVTFYVAELLGPRSNVQLSLFLRVSLGHAITVGFAELIFTSFIRISRLNPKCRHNVILATSRIVQVRRAKAFIWRKVQSRSPRRVRDPHVNGWLDLQRNKLKVFLARATREEGCLRYPRPYKWGLTLTGKKMYIFRYITGSWGIVKANESCRTVYYCLVMMCFAAYCL